MGNYHIHPPQKPKPGLLQGCFGVIAFGGLLLLGAIVILLCAGVMF